MSGTSYGACVLHVAPESYVGGPLALVRDGDLIEMDVAARKLELKVNVTSKTLLNINSGKFYLTVTFKLVSNLKPTFVYHQQSVLININLADPCFTTSIDDQPITTFPA